MISSFGTRLRQQREQQHIALATISADTKIKLSLLEGLERDDVSHWPDGIFRHAYVRAYARAIHAEPDVVLRQFLEIHGSSGDVLPRGCVVWPEVAREQGSQPAATGLRRLVTSAIAAVPTLVHRGQFVESSVTAAVGDAGLYEAARVVPRAALAPVASAPAPIAARRPDLSMTAAAQLCTRLGRVVEPCEIVSILDEALALLDGTGLIVWWWDPRANALRQWIACGYSDAVLARVPIVKPDSRNAIASAFRSAEACTVEGGDGVTGAIAVPLMSSGGCGGVLAVELGRGDEQREDVRAFASILAAQLVTFIGSAPAAEAATA